MKKPDFDVLIIGAGLSGIGAGCHLQRLCPERSYVIMEARKAIGGTWDLFRYPGVRSDSDMHTLGYSFRPWDGDKVLADGADIRSYIQDSARAFDIESRILFQHKVMRASWSSGEALWTVEAQTASGPQVLRCRWLHSCAGYYKFDKAHMPDFKGKAAFQGDIIHPQFWPEDYDYSGKKVAVIGSGATAVTLVPAMAERADHVTMVQRSPSYLLSRPAKDKTAHLLRNVLPKKLAYTITRRRNIALQNVFYTLCQAHPQTMKRRLLGQVKAALGSDYPVETHFSPQYGPWDQRLCLVPDGDFFRALVSQKASIATGAIKTFTPDGIKLDTGEQIRADIIVTATGLELQFMGGVALTVDTKPVNVHDEFTYRGCMISNIPNLTTVFGYTNASWTLRADLVTKYLCRVLKLMARENYNQARPVYTALDVGGAYLNLSSNYIKRSATQFPQQARKAPWIMNQNYGRDERDLLHKPVRDEYLRLSRSV